jgi:hypothetical protein
MNGIVRFTILAIATGTMSACQRSDEYSPPVLAPNEAAIIVGSKLPDPNPMEPDTRAYVVSIDGKLTSDGPHGWDHRNVITPGAHTIKFGIAKTSLMHEAWGFGETQLLAGAGRTYVIRTTQPQKITSVCATSLGWFEDDNNAEVTAKTSITITTYTGSEIGLPGGGFVSIPSHSRCQ